MTCRPKLQKNKSLIRPGFKNTCYTNQSSQNEVNDGQYLLILYKAEKCIEKIAFAVSLRFQLEKKKNRSRQQPKYLNHENIIVNLLCKSCRFTSSIVWAISIKRTSTNKFSKFLRNQFFKAIIIKRSRL